MKPSTPDLTDKKSISRFFNLLEDRRPEKIAEAAGVLGTAYLASLERSHVIGITGPPGVGKSCLTSRLIQSLRREERSVGVIAVDPSSRSSGGALLGDRVRLEYDANDPKVFVRSMASRGDLGGISDRTFAGIVLLRSVFDIVLVETVGVGQSESEIALLADTTLLVIQPGSGDMLQFLKAGIMETPHLLAVNKSDRAETAQRTLHEVRAALGHLAPAAGEWKPQVLACSALNGTGIEEILRQAGLHADHLRNAGGLSAARRNQAAHWIAQTLRSQYGERGISSLGGLDAIRKRMSDPSEPGPFQLIASLSNEIESKRGN